MTTIDIENVSITPVALSVLAEMQSCPEAFLDPIENAEEHILNDPSENSAIATLTVLRDLNYLKKTLLKLTQKGGGQ